MSDTTPISQAYQVLCAGGIIAYPTEAVYGIGCDPFNQKAVERIAKIKSRHPQKSFILVGSQLRHIEPFCATAQADFYQDAQATWPGPHTWVFSATETCPQWLRNNDNSIAVRISAHSIVIELCNTFGGALISTSANLSGDTPATTAAQAQDMFKDAIDYVVPGNVGEAQRPTTIRDARNGEVIRP